MQNFMRSLAKISFRFFLQRWYFIIVMIDDLSACLLHRARYSVPRCFERKKKSNINEIMAMTLFNITLLLLLTNARCSCRASISTVITANGKLCDASADLNKKRSLKWKCAYVCVPIITYQRHGNKTSKKS